MFLAVFLLFTVATLSSGEVVRSTREFLSAGQTRRALSRSGLRAFPRRLGILSLGLFGGILLMTAGLFFILPRTARAAFQRFAPERYHLPGFSNEVTLGEIGEIKQSSTPVMHVFSQGDGFLAVHWPSFLMPTAPRYSAMTGDDLRDLRAQAGLSLVEFARALGYTGSDANENRRIRRLEAFGVDPIPEADALRAYGFELEWQAQRVREYQRILRMRRAVR